MSLTQTALEARYHFALDLARKAGTIALGYFRAGGATGTTLKGPQDYLTLADTAVDSLIRQSIAAAFPEDAVLTEETGGASGEYLWVVDPIDGTANFARGIGCFAISIAFCVNGVTELSLVFDPVADELFSARRGMGAWCNGEPIAVSAQAEPGRAALDIGYSRRRPTADYAALVEQMLDDGYDVMQFGSAARGLAYVAAGRVEGFYERHLYSWDVLAGLLLVAEAGGYADPFAYWDAGGPVLASNAALAEPLKARLSTLL